MIPQPPPGQGPIDPRGAFNPPPPPPGYRPGGMPPPQGMPPMPPMMPTPMFMQPPRERSFARAIFMTLATTIFGLSLAANIYLLLFSGLMSGGMSARQNTVLEGNPLERIAIIPVNGVIMTDGAQQFDRFMKLAEADKNVKAIVIEIDSPGGTVTASDEIHHRIVQFKTNRPGVPVVATMGSLAASGGYYVACAADYVFAQPTTMTGNIGVLFPRYNISRLADKWGIEETTLESTGAPYKNAGSMLKPENPEEVKYFQEIIDKSFMQFKEVVQNGRGNKLTRPLSEIANGKIYLGPEAQALGLVDEIGYLQDAYLHAAQGLKKPQVVRYMNPPSLLEALAMKSNIGSIGASSNGTVNVQLDWQKLQEFTTPRMLYLWRGE
ncbi:MAG TPA: signal peptide peptidase SppA [Tepidisphaeraceae bacterium]|nr:signal peptide peptidase SppA [Tepidisphaeraceae bacterium]